MELQLKNIGMIKEANIKIDGLTVIAGENDTGKSTVGKALYLYLHNENYPTLINSLFKNKLSTNLPLENNENLLISGIVQITDEKTTDYSCIVIESPLVWNFTDFFRDIAQIESQMRIELDYPYLMKDLNFKLHIKSSLNGLDIKEKVTSLIGGEFKKDEMGRYYFDKQRQRIELVNTATGIKYFGIFQILSQNNYLNENTVLVLDEPEVHLHPKWQLEMAKIIIELVSKEVKIVVNSHSPYMIEALELYSKKANISRNFYLAQKEKNHSRIEDVTKDTSPIYNLLAEPFDILEDEEMDSVKW